MTDLERIEEIRGIAYDWEEGEDDVRRTSLNMEDVMWLLDLAERQARRLEEAENLIEPLITMLKLQEIDRPGFCLDTEPHSIATPTERWYCEHCEVEGRIPTETIHTPECPVAKARQAFEAAAAWLEGRNAKTTE